jgi:metal-responsive CopG/Arc/MetJ family transcriptional regulator
MGKAQISFTSPPELTAKLDAEMSALGYAKRSEIVRKILADHFERKEQEARTMAGSLPPRSETRH